MRRTIILSIGFIYFLSSCANDNEDNNEVNFSKISELLSTPTFDKQKISAGEKFIVTLKASANVDYAYIEAADTGSNDFYAKPPVISDNEVQVEVSTSCAMNSGTYFPTITIANGSGSSEYRARSTGEPKLYEVKKEVQVPLGIGFTSESKVEDSSIEAQAIEIIQPAGDLKSNLMVSIENITINEKTLTVDYELTNLGERAAANFGIDFWSNLDTPPSDDEKIEDWVGFFINHCINPGEIINGSAIINKSSESGTAYARVSYFNPDEETDSSDNLSDGFSW